MQGGLRVEDHRQQRGPHQRLVEEGLAEDLAHAGVVDGLADGAAHQGGGAHGVGEAGDVEHLGHLPEPVGELTDGRRVRLVQCHLAAGDGTRPQLVLEPVDADGVARAVGAQPWDEEHAEPARPLSLPGDAGEGEDDIGGRIGGEPLLAGEGPVVALLGGDGLRQPYVRSPCFSVMNIAPEDRSSGSVEERAAISSAYRSGSKRRRMRAAESVMESGQAMPNSDCT